MKRAVIGCDLGATNLRVAVISDGGQILASMRERLTDRTPSLVARDLATMSEEVLRLAKHSWDDISGIGVGLAGQVLGQTGVVLVGPNLGWRDVRFGSLVERELGRAPRIVNDLSAAAWGEHKVGAARGVADALVVFLGSGVGAGLILGGKLYEGADGLAGEIGHMKVRHGGRLCGCGERGCLEAYVGGHNVKVRLQELVEAGEGEGILEAAGGDIEKVGTHALESAAAANDPVAIAFLEEMAELLGFVVGNLITVLNPQKLILGGGLFHGLTNFMPLVDGEIRKVAGRGQMRRVSILESALEDDAGLIGAALLSGATGSLRQA